MARNDNVLVDEVIQAVITGIAQLPQEQRQVFYAIVEERANAKADDEGAMP